MKDSPFVEQLVPANSKDKSAIAARKRLQAVLDGLAPETGKTLSAEDQDDVRTATENQR
jgi:hypothetical protein